jgi:hypothetical protein
MRPPRTLAATLIGAALLVTGTGCQANPPATQGSTVTTGTAQMPDLPKDPDASEALVRTMMMKEAIVLLKTAGLKYTAAQFDVPSSYDEKGAQNGDLLIEFRSCTDEQVEAMTAAIWANGWQQAGISHGVNVRKGPLFLQWGIGYGGCRFEMTTVNISQYLPGIENIKNVPELAAFKA